MLRGIRQKYKVLKNLKRKRSLSMGDQEAPEWFCGKIRLCTCVNLKRSKNGQTLEQKTEQWISLAD